MAFIDKKIFLILAFLFALLSIFVFGTTHEGFANLTPGTFPISVDVPILHEYPFKKHMGVSNNTYAVNSTYYPIFGSSYGQFTNNVRYWKTPNNGQCSPAEFCGGLYDDKKIDEPKTPKQIPFSSHDVRVNYYGSHNMECPSK
jgi:hypothetical protein|tara:strand:+ start:9081 stop:9509 length:429 start_codon:yes stop_codon:yes gene_type:complete